MEGAIRRCPLCKTTCTEALCPNDGMATLLAAAPPSDPSLVAPGTMIGGRYRVEHALGVGGFGVVFAAVHTRTGQKVAVKVLSGAGRTGTTSLERFFLEARATASLQHPNTIRVFDFGQEDSGLVYIAMELLAGRTLADELRRRISEGRAFTEAEAAEIAVSVTKSLGEAHSAGLVHRDLKPENIFLHELPGGERVVKVLDFGIVKSLGEAGPLLTSVGTVIGTPAYMSPEQVHARGLDRRSDLYSLGVMLYQMTTGELPFTGDKAMQVMLQHARAPVPDLRARAKGTLSDAFVGAVLRAMAKDPADRFPDAASMRDALLARAPATPAALPVVDRPRRSFWPLALGAGGAVLAAALIGAALLSRRDDGSPVVEALDAAAAVVELPDAAQPAAAPDAAVIAPDSGATAHTPSPPRPRRSRPPSKTAPLPRESNPFETP